MFRGSRIKAGGELAQHLSSTVAPLLIHDLPVVLWWPDDVPFGRHDFTELADDNLATFAPPWMITLPGLGFRQALAMTQASTALSIVAPGGAAVGMAGSWGMLRGWGYPTRAVTRAITLTGVWNQLANLVFPVVALFLLKANGGETALLGTAAFVGVAVLGVVVAVLVLVLYSENLARDVGDVVARFVSWVEGARSSRPGRRSAARASCGSAARSSTCSPVAGTC